MLAAEGKGGARTAKVQAWRGRRWVQCVSFAPGEAEARACRPTDSKGPSSQRSGPHSRPAPTGPVACAYLSELDRQHCTQCSQPPRAPRPPGTYR